MYLSSGDHCLELRRAFPSRNMSIIMDRFYWADRNCKYDENFYICEKKPIAERDEESDCSIDIKLQENFTCYLYNQENYTDCKLQTYNNGELQINFEINRIAFKRNCYVFLKTDEKLRSFVSVNSNNTLKNMPTLFSDKKITKVLFVSDSSKEKDGFRLFLLSKNYTVILKTLK